MGRRKRTEEQQARRALISELLSAANVQSIAAAIPATAIVPIINLAFFFI